PARYLVVAMDRGELRPGGGFMGNYGVLTLADGKQSNTQPLVFGDVYDIDRQYFLKLHGPDLHDCSRDVVPPPQLYWWWPYRLNGSEQRCDFDWGLRDSNLSPDFPTNARAAMQIVQQSGIVPGNRPLQGVIAFTPVLIEGLLASDVFGPVYVPEFKA